MRKGLKKSARVTDVAKTILFKKKCKSNRCGKNNTF